MLDFETTKLLAQFEGEPQFEHFCATHGLSKFFTATEECVSCLRDQLKKLSSDEYTARKTRRRNKPDNRLRTEARHRGDRTYPDICDIHGATDFHVGTGRCFTCFTAGGQARRANRDAARSDAPRAVARRDGRRTFAAPCAEHGPDTAHSVAHGKCLKCFNVVGARRKVPWEVDRPYVDD